MFNERKTLISALLKAEKSGYSNIVLNNVLNETNLDSTQKAFVTTVFYGVLERKKIIDYVLDKYLKHPVKKAPPFTSAVLRSGVYQILFMEKVPKFAAVNEAVSIIKKSKERGNSGLVNAVLRKISGEDIKTLINGAEPFVKYSVSKWLYERLVLYYGRETTENFLDNSLSAPPIFIKTNQIKADAKIIVKSLAEKGVSLEATQLPNTFKAVGIKGIENTIEYKTGMFYVQDYSSSVCAAAVLAKKGMRVLDACAAPGGKTFSMALEMENEGEIVSCDIHEHRVMLIENGAKRLGIDIIGAKKLDATKFNPDLGLFDRVLCDVPCSGIGVIRRKPEIKYKTEEECSALCDIQLKILNNCAKYVKKGGRLIYSTCTLLKTENEDIVSAFLKENGDFAPTEVGALGIKETNVTFIPPNFSGDGFFIATFVRK